MLHSFPTPSRARLKQQPLFQKLLFLLRQLVKTSNPRGLGWWFFLLEGTSSPGVVGVSTRCTPYSFISSLSLALSPYRFFLSWSRRCSPFCCCCCCCCYLLFFVAMRLIFLFCACWLLCSLPGVGRFFMYISNRNTHQKNKPRYSRDRKNRPIRSDLKQRESESEKTSSDRVCLSTKRARVRKEICAS